MITIHRISLMFTFLLLSWSKIEAAFEDFFPPRIGLMCRKAARERTRKKKNRLGAAMRLLETLGLTLGVDARALELGRVLLGLLAAADALGTIVDGDVATFFADDGGV